MGAENICTACHVPVLVAGAFLLACFESFGGVIVTAENCLFGVGLRPYASSPTFWGDGFFCPFKCVLAFEIVGRVASPVPRLFITTGVSCLTMLLVERLAIPCLEARFVSLFS